MADAETAVLVKEEVKLEVEDEDYVMSDAISGPSTVSQVKSEELSDNEVIIEDKPDIVSLKEDEKSEDSPMEDDDDDEDEDGAAGGGDGEDDDDDEEEDDGEDDGEKDNMCKVCKKVFESEEELREHYRHPNGPNSMKTFACCACKKLFSNIYQMKEHWRKHSRKFLRCSKCPNVYWQKATLLRHEHHAHRKNMYKCKQGCKGVMFSDFDEFERHYLAHHENGKFSCYDCDVACNDKELLRRHVRTHLSKTHVDSNQCDLCSKHFRRLQVSSHMRRHADVQARLPCSVCELKFKSDLALETHKQLIHLLFNCDECGAEFGNKEALARHVRSKHLMLKDSQGSLLLECKVCQKICGTMRAFEQHATITHSNLNWQELYAELKEFSCQFCDKSLKTIRAINTHIKTHRNVTEHDTYNMCKACHRHFMTYRAYEKHVKHIHPSASALDLYQEKLTLTCFFCGKTEATAKVLNRHLKQEHSEIPKPERTFIECRVCNWYVISEQQFKKHVVKHHPDTKWEDAYQPRSQLVCSICGLVKDRILRMNSHRKHHEVIMEREKDAALGFIECKLCRLFYSSKSAFKRHVLVAHGLRESDDLIVYKKNMKCWICDKGHDQVKVLNAHIKCHAEYSERLKESLVA